MDLSIIHDTDVIKSENENLLQQNRELRKMLLLLQENVELRNILEKSNCIPEETQPRAMPTKPKEENANSNTDTSKSSKERPRLHSETINGSKYYTDGATYASSSKYQTDEATYANDSKYQTDLIPHASGSKYHTEVTALANGAKYQTDGAKLNPVDGAKQVVATEQSKECGAHSPQSSYQLHLMQHIIGEIAFQLDRRILTYIFPEHTRLYGISVANIPQKIIEASTDGATGKVDEKKQDEMMKRYEEIMATLKQYGYDISIHPTFSENVVNVYGIMKEYPPSNSPEMRSLCDPANLKKIAYCAVPTSDLENVLILLKCLSKLSRRDGKPIFLL